MPRQVPARYQNPGQFSMQAPRAGFDRGGYSLRRISEFEVKVAWKAREWQREAFVYRSLVAEAGYVLDKTADGVADCDLRLLYLDDDGEWVDCNDPDALAIDEYFVGPVGGRRQLLRSAALNLGTAGETYLVAYPTIDPDRTLEGDSPGLLWEYLSVNELRVEGNGRVRRDWGSGIAPAQGRFDSDHTLISRLWMPDPEYAVLPDCAMRRVLPTLKELVMLQQVIDAEVTGRMNAGMIFVPEGMSFGPLQDAFAEDPDAPDVDAIDPFTEVLLEHMSAPVNDRSSAASLVPLVLRGEADQGEKIKWLSLTQPRESAGAWARPLRDEALKRLAQGMDAPPEVMTGKSDVNHWTGFSIDDEFASKHIVPLGDFIANHATTAMLRPMLRIFCSRTPQNAQRYKYVFDSSNIMSKADAGQTALQLFDRKIIGPAATLRANGFEESNLINEEEMAEAVALELLALNPTAFLPLAARAIPSLKTLLPHLGPGQSAALPAAPAPGGTPAPPGGSGGGAIPKAAQPDQTPPKPQGEGGEPQTNPALPVGNAAAVDHRSSTEFRVLQARLLAFSHSTVARALEIAGSRVVSRMNRKGAEEVRDTMRRIDKRDALSVLDDTQIDLLGTSRETLLRGTLNGYDGEVTRWIRDYAASARLTTRNLPSAVGALTDAVLRSANVGGHEYANGLMVPDEAVAQALDMALDS